MKRCISVIVLGLIAGAAVAQTPPGALRSAASGDVSYVSAGVGEEDQARMQSLAREGYTLKLLFAEQGTGAYVADVRVIVTDGSGRNVLDAVSSGPAFFARLPEGDYRVTLEYRGRRESRTVHASARAAQTVVHWPQEPGSAPLPADTRAPHAEDAAPALPHAGPSAGTQ